MTVPTLGTVRDYGHRGEMVDLTYEEREWICVFCKQPQPYVLINGCCQIGIGGSSRHYGGRRAEHCSKPECYSEAERFLGLPNSAVSEPAKNQQAGGKARWKGKSKTERSAAASAAANARWAKEKEEL